MKPHRAKAKAIQQFERRTFAALIALLAVFAALYAYFVSTSIVNVLVREETEEHIARVTAEISELEFAYLNAKNKITYEHAQALGLSPLSYKSYITRTSLLSQDTLTRNDEI